MVKEDQEVNRNMGIVDLLNSIDFQVVAFVGIAYLVNKLHKSGK